LPGEISVTSDIQMTPLLWQKAKGTKELLDQHIGFSGGK